MGIESMGGYIPDEEEREAPAEQPKTTRRGFLKFLGGAAAAGVAMTRSGDRIEHAAREATGEAAQMAEGMLTDEADDESVGDKEPPNINPERSQSNDAVRSLSEEARDKRDEPGHFDSARDTDEWPGA